MTDRAIPSLTLATVLSCIGCADGPGEPERAAYVTLMGDDTLAIEWMAFTQGAVDAQALIRGSETTFSEYHLEMDEDGRVTGYTQEVYAAGAQGEAPLRSVAVTSGEDGRWLVLTRDGEEERREFSAPPGSVPFIDMLHWPFEAALRHQARHGGFGDAIPTFTGRGMSFGLIANDDDSWGLRHPSRGVSTFEMDADGRILALDGTGSTRAYDLTRIPFDQLDRAEMRARFADRPLGELSGRGEIDDEVAGVHFTGHYGAPRKRGRDIFGGLLAYGIWWRTGANQATHFSLDGDIVIDGQLIPAGDYTLSSIPEEDGGELIINTRTGQGGQSYDEAEDLARVRMRRDTLDEIVETFEIRVVEAEEGGRIELRWDDTVYWVPFTVS